MDLFDRLLSRALRQVLLMDQEFTRWKQLAWGLGMAAWGGRGPQGLDGLGWGQLSELASLESLWERSREAGGEHEFLTIWSQEWALKVRADLGTDRDAHLRESHGYVQHMLCGSGARQALLGLVQLRQAGALAQAGQVDWSDPWAARDLALALARASRQRAQLRLALSCDGKSNEAAPRL